jgi:MFS family permease
MTGMDDIDAQQGDPAISTYQRWSGLLLLTAGYAAYNIDKSVLAVLIEPIKHEFHLTDSTVGLLSGLAMIIPFILTCIPLGILADRMSRKWLMAILLVGWSLSAGSAGFAAGVALLFIARVGVGLFEGGFTPTSLSLVNDLFPEKNRATAMGIFAIGAPLGAFVSMAAGGYIAQYYGWRMAFFMAAVPGLLVAFLIALMLREPARTKRDFAPPPKLKALLGDIWQNGPLLNTAIGMAYCAVVVASLAIWSPSFLIRIFKLSPHEAGISAAVVVGVCGAIGASTAGYIADKRARQGDWRRLSVALFGIFASIICGALAFVVAQTLAAALLLLGLTAFFGQFYLGIGNSVIATHAPTQNRAGTLAILTIGFNITAFGIAPSLVGIVSDFVKVFAGDRAIGWALATTLLFSLAGAAHFWRTRTYLRIGLGRLEPHPIKGDLNVIPSAS